MYGIKRYRSSDLLEWRGPLYESMEVEEKKLRVRFVEGTANGLRLDQDEEAGFYIAGADQEFHHARVRVDGGDKSLIVWSDEVPDATGCACRLWGTHVPIARCAEDARPAN